MLNKEIEEDIKEIDIIITTIRKILQKDIKITDEEVYILDGRQYLAIENLLQYINQLESDKQKLIEKLEEDIEKFSNYEERKQMCKEQLFENDGKWFYAQEILKILKGENDEFKSN